MTGLAANTASDHYARIAAELHELADQIAKVAGTGTAALSSVHVSIGEYGGTKHEVMTEAVDAVAAAVGATPTTKFEGRGTTRRGERVAILRSGLIRFRVFATVPVPPTRAQKLADLQRENDDLRARLAAGGRA